MSAVLRLDGTGVVVANVLEEVRLNGILDVIGVDTLSNNPWDVSVRWGKSLGSLGNFVLELNGILTVVARKNIFDLINFGGGGTGFSEVLIVRSGIRSLNAVDELE